MNEMTEKNQLRSTWWGRYSFDEGQTVQWEIGPLKLAVQRQPNEWQITYEQNEVFDLETTAWNHNPTAPDIGELNYKNTERYATGQPGKTLWVMPMLADRPIITRPLTPLYVPVGEKTTIFVSSPLWVRIDVGDPPVKLQEVPLLRPSDTWFGPSTMEGELCYASRTYARLNLDNIPTRAHRAITQIIIENKAGTQLLVERLSLPVPYLSLFEASNGLLWTETVTMIRTRDTGMATFQTGKKPPKEAPKAKLVSEPREKPGQNMVIRAFGALFR
jgi:hypothetical protein